jgi:YD repeat-containing protein
MWLRWISAHFLFFAALHATVPDWSIISTENEPSVFVDGKVNAISGKWTPVIEDLTIQGVEPIHLRRTWNGDGHWAMDPSLHIEWDKIGKIHYFTLTETSGAELQYKYTKKKARFNGEDYLCCIPANLSQGYTNTSRGRPSSRTNLHNNHLYVSPKNKTFILQAADGALRTFELLRGSSQYKLVSEQLPNGNWILYSYADKHVLTSIRTTNPDRSVTYAQADLLHNSCLSIRGSDGQFVEYGYQTGSLTSVQSSAGPDQFFHYNRQKDHILSVQYPLGRKYDIDYYPSHPGPIKVHGETISLSNTELDTGEETIFLQDLRYNRVKTLSAPTGEDGAPLTTHALLYNPQNRTTTVFDIEDLKTVYQWDQNFRLTEITHYGKEGTLDRVEKFAWSSEGNLLCKSILDANRSPLIATTYEYNSWNDITEERVYGNLSGSGAPLSLDASGLPIKNGVEHYARRYRYSKALSTPKCDK